MAARSTHVSIDNMAGRFNLRRTAMSLEHGEWTNEPPLLIGNRGDWESESNGFATGTEGHVTYQIEDDEARRIGELRLHWDNPFVGSNSYDESVAPAATSATDTGFSIVHSGGGGDNASVTFTLLNAFCTIDPQDGIVCSSASPVTDAGPDARARFAAIWSRGVGTTWHAVHDLGSAQYQQKFDELVGQGFRVVDVSGYGIGGQDRYAAIFSQDGGPPFAARHGLTNAQYQQAFDQLTGQGMRPVCVNGYAVGGEDRYAAIFEQRDGPAFAARHGLTNAQYQQTFDELTGQGFRPIHVSGYAVGGEDRYAAIFEQRDGPGFAARHGLTNAQYQQAFDQLTGQGFRLVNVSGYLVGGQDRYAAIFEQDGGPGFAARHGLTSAEYQRTFDELLGQGLRLVQVCGYGDG